MKRRGNSLRNLAMEPAGEMSATTTHKRGIGLCRAHRTYQRNGSSFCALRKLLKRLLILVPCWASGNARSARFSM